MSWTPAQAGMLAAMGYEPMQRRPWEAPPDPARVSAQAGAATAAPGPVAAPPRRVAPPMAAARAPDAMARPAGNPAAFAAALQRAAGGRDVAALVDDLERLRRDPALKRALWPRLRALRRLQ